MKIAIDAAHGAGYFFGVQIFEKLGAQVVATGVNPDGVNINEEGGATKPETNSGTHQIFWCRHRNCL